MGLRGEGLRRKLMFKLVVTARGTMPMVASMATYSATSATAMSRGPDTVPPGRNCAGPTACETVAERSPTSSTTTLLCGNSRARKSTMSALLGIGSSPKKCRWPGQNIQSRQRRIASRLFGRKRLQRAALFAALGTTHALGDVLEPRVPAAQAAQCKRLRFAFMAALRTLHHQGVLAELVAQFVDVES